MNTAQLLVKCLEEEGVQYIFGIAGEENLAFIDALKDSEKIRFVTVRHEQGAAFMADVYGRLTGKAGVCLATLGPGATNLITGVADADSDGAPLVAITGQVDTDRMHITSHQYLALDKMFEPVTKRTKLVVNPDTINEIVRLAFKYAEGERPGATHIDLPADVAKMEVHEGTLPLKRKVAPGEFPEITSLQLAEDMINEAVNPVVLVGAGAVRNQAAAELTMFAEGLKIPVINTMMAKGMIPFTSRYAMLTVGIPQMDYQNMMLEKADLVICVGYDLMEYAPGKWNRDNGRKILHIDQSPAHVNQHYQPEVEVIGDIKASLYWLAGHVRVKAESKEMFELKKRLTEEIHQYDGDDSYPMKPQRILSDIRAVMGEEDILISDVGAHKVWIARDYHCYKPNTCIISNGFASMGIAVPGAIGARFVTADKRILAVTGDGGFMMNCQELETAVREHTPFVVLIINDSAYGLIKWKQLDQYHQTEFCDFTNPDFVKLAESMGAVGYRVEHAQQLKPFLEQAQKEAFQKRVPVIIDCPVDYSENTRLSQHLKEVTQQ
ncbi:MAG: acetolactate synthase large subunit [Lachnospiraceae bacterium]|nr:acetolactate synthase large subunit [Lachnospiraceae bacterium]